jgi:hypothetical protein
MPTSTVLHIYISHNENIPFKFFDRDLIRTYQKIWTINQTTSEKNLPKVLPDHILFLTAQFNDNKVVIHKYHNALDQNVGDTFDINDFLDLIKKIQLNFSVADTVLYMDANLGQSCGEKINLTVIHFIDEIKPSYLTLFSGTPACVSYTQSWSEYHQDMFNETIVHHNTIQKTNEEFESLNPKETPLKLLRIVNLKEIPTSIFEHLSMLVNFSESKLTSQDNEYDPKANMQRNPSLETLERHSKKTTINNSHVDSSINNNPVPHIRSRNSMTSLCAICCGFFFRSNQPVEIAPKSISFPS